MNEAGEGSRCSDSTSFRRCFHNDNDNSTPPPSHSCGRHSPQDVLLLIKSFKVRSANMPKRKVMCENFDWGVICIRSDVLQNDSIELNIKNVNGRRG